MPVLSAYRDNLFRLLERQFSDDEFEDICFRFGLELDDITEEIDGEGVSRTMYKIDIPANRYDLLSPEGLAISLKVFLGGEVPAFEILKEESVIYTSEEMSKIRPFIFSAIVKDVSLDKDAYDNIIRYQEKLHHTLGKKRTLVSIGVHDYDTLRPPFYYCAHPPERVEFTPLAKEKKMKGREILELYETDINIGKYTHIIKDISLYPLLTDDKSTVCSLPPIINGNHSRVTLDTRNLFIEVTATDYTKGEIVLRTLASVFSLYSREKFTIVPLRTKYDFLFNKLSCVQNMTERVKDDENGYMKEWILQKNITKHHISLEEVNDMLGTDFDVPSMSVHLRKMMYTFSFKEDLRVFEVEPSFCRSDVLHACDIIEDIAISFGYNNIKKNTPKIFTIGLSQELDDLCGFLRHEMAFSGYSEVLGLMLCSMEDNSLKGRCLENNDVAVKVCNPKSSECQITRTSLIPGLLRFIGSNRMHGLPLKIFEVSDVVLLDSDSEYGSTNQRRLSVMYCDSVSRFEFIHGCLDNVMRKLDIRKAKDSAEGYSIKPSDNKMYLSGQCCDIFYNSLYIGSAGVLHPDVSVAFQIPYPITLIEINIEPFR